MRPAAVSSGDSHHRSVRRVFAVICARPVAGSRVEDTSVPVLDGFHLNNLAFSATDTRVGIDGGMLRPGIPHRPFGIVQ